MSCDSRAVLIVTRQMEGTSTNVARQRFQLHCALENGHSGPHRDNEHEQEWEMVEGRPTLLLRDEEDALPVPSSGKS
ncbi:MAG TPA: hypothetical protein VHV51_02775 [Polyangiaceae bacterium]|jgi:hypothetical protein|nr:hypothetical protein [Polyangiaceae bacterium]